MNENIIGINAITVMIEKNTNSGKSKLKIKDKIVISKPPANQTFPAS